MAFIAHYIGGTRDLPEVMTKSSIYRWDGGQFNFATYYPSLASSSTQAWNGLDQQSYIGVANQSTVNFDYRTPSKIYHVNIESLSKNGYTLAHKTYCFVYALSLNTSKNFYELYYHEYHYNLQLGIST